MKKKSKFVPLLILVLLLLAVGFLVLQRMDACAHSDPDPDTYADPAADLHHPGELADGDGTGSGGLS